MHNQYLREQKFKKELWEEKSPYTEEAKWEEKKLSASDTIAMAKEKKKEADRQKLRDAWEKELASVTDEVLEDIALHPENYSDEELERIETITDYKWQQNSKLKYYFPISTFLLDGFASTHFIFKYDPKVEERRANSAKVNLELQPSFASVAGVGGSIVLALAFAFFPLLFVELPFIAPAMYIYLKYMEREKGQKVSPQKKFVVFLGSEIVALLLLSVGLCSILTLGNNQIGASFLFFLIFFICAFTVFYLLSPKKEKR